jgi:hypothetical protein
MTSAMISSRWQALILGIFSTCLGMSVSAKDLITREEANLPEYTLVERDVFPGPKITSLFPAADGATVTSPVHLKVRFERRGANIDLDSLTVTYLKNPLVDLTDRVRAFASRNGIDMPDAQVPPGNHRIRIEVKDVDGSSGRSEVTLRVRR